MVMDQLDRQAYRQTGTMLPIDEPRHVTLVYACIDTHFNRTYAAGVCNIAVTWKLGDPHAPSDLVGFSIHLKLCCIAQVHLHSFIYSIIHRFVAFLLPVSLIQSCMHPYNYLFIHSLIH